MSFEFREFSNLGNLLVIRPFLIYSNVISHGSTSQPRQPIKNQTLTAQSLSDVPLTV